MNCLIGKSTCGFYCVSLFAITNDQIWSWIWTQVSSLSTCANTFKYSETNWQEGMKMYLPFSKVTTTNLHFIGIACDRPTHGALVGSVRKTRSTFYSVEKHVWLSVRPPELILLKPPSTAIIIPSLLGDVFPPALKTKISALSSLQNISGRQIGWRASEAISVASLAKIFSWI